MLFHSSSLTGEDRFERAYTHAQTRTHIAGVTSGAAGAWTPLAEILEEQKFESKSVENDKRKTSST